MMEKDAIKTRVLAENTAQGILNHLRELESNRARVQGRWVWELLQNARDAGADADTSLIASVELQGGELVFQHNGRGFTSHEVAHLIFHGSTKVEDDTTIGQYGSGFLTTHLLSAEIAVSGKLEDGGYFDFPLKREVSSAKALGESMDQAWSQFDATGDPLPDGFTTRFTYPIGDDATATVLEGIENLKRCAPLVVAFNSPFKRVQIVEHGSTTSFEVTSRVALNQPRFERISVEIRTGDGKDVRDFILAHGDDASVAAPIGSSDRGEVCLPVGEVPKLFLGFPLVGTEGFSFPAVINSFHFGPTESRDGVFLGQSDDEVNSRNQLIIQEACHLHVKLLQLASQSSIMNAYTLATVPPVRDQNWLNASWLRECLAQLVGQIRRTPVLPCERDIKPPADALLPVAANEHDVTDLWALLSRIDAIEEKLPQDLEAAGWSTALRTWAEITQQEECDFEEAFSGARLARYIEDASNSPNDPGTLDDIDVLLTEGTGVVAWLDRLFQHLLKADHEAQIRQRKIVPSQSGHLAMLSELHVDDRVDDVLKEVADDLLGLKLRARLRDPRFPALASEPGKGALGNDEVIGQIIEALKKPDGSDVDVENRVLASAGALAWILQNIATERLIGFPAFARDTERTALLLAPPQSDDHDADIPLVPVVNWPEGLQEFAGLFPSRYILADAYSDALRAPDDWNRLRDLGYVRLDVVVRKSQQITEFIPDRPLPEGEHITAEPVEATDLAFLSRHRIGIMERVRDSQERARLFWRFLTEWLVTQDADGLKTKTASCLCGGEHRYLGANWVVPLAGNRWVPQGNDTRDIVSAHSLATLLRESGWRPTSLAESCGTNNLLAALGITRLDLTREFLVGSEQAKQDLDAALTNVLAATDGDLADVNQFLEDMKSDKDLVAHLNERRERRQIVHQNQRMGEQVERLVKQALEAEGFTVRRTGIGSDFEIEYDFVADDEEVGLELSRDGKSWLVEVKATREQRVRMTAVQARTAVAEGERFLLCVVPVESQADDIENGDAQFAMWFVQHLGPRLRGLCEELDALNELRDDATAGSDDDIQLEIQAGTARLQVKQAVWLDGVGLGDLPNHLT